MIGTAAPTSAPVSLLFGPAIFSPAIAPKIFASMSTPSLAAIAHGRLGRFRQAVGRTSQLLVGNPANLLLDERLVRDFWLKSAIGTRIEKDWTRIDGLTPNIRKKGD
jgi:hypothetical protein